MSIRRAAPTNMDEYIAASPSKLRPILRKIRRTIRTAAPGARELISYRMPAFRLHGILVYFAAFKNHIGIYPPVSGDARLEKALAPYAGPKGNLKFPLGQPIPYALIKRVVLLRVKQDLARAAKRRRKRGSAAPLRPPPSSRSPGDRSVSSMGSTMLGVRLAFFPAFKGVDSVLLHGTSQQIYTLVPRLYEFLASSLEEWPVHEHALISSRHPARLFVSRLGMSSSTGFRWRCSPAELPLIQAKLQALAVSGSGHHYFELAGSTARLIVSAAEYPESWWRENA